MSDIENKERDSQNRVIKLFQERLNYTYLGNFTKRENNSNIETELLTKWLQDRGISEVLIQKSLRELHQASSIGGGKKLYEANREIYLLLRYGVKVKESLGDKTKTIWLIDWSEPLNNEFYISEEVTIKGENKKRPDIVVYVNGIALSVIELKRSTVSISEGIRQNLDNQKKEFIRDFFTTIQLVVAGNDSQGVKYGVIETPEKYYLEWREENPDYNPKIDDKNKKYLPSDCENNPLDCATLRLFDKTRFLELIHDFIVFDSGVKKICRHNQYFGIKLAQKYIKRREGGIIWHTQGSGKSLSMVWLAKWIRENIANSRVLIVTDREELDAQIESKFNGVSEKIYRTSSGNDLIGVLNANIEWLMCSLIHKFGRNREKANEEFIRELQNSISKGFKAKGEIFVFVDECHRTQSGKLHKAMKAILANATFIGFTGTPLLKSDKKISIEVFGAYIHTYKFDEAIEDKVILDLRYEARDIDQFLTSKEKIDNWFEAKTKGLSDMAKVRLKQKWGTMQKVLSSKSRLEQIVNDIELDMATKEGLMGDNSSAILVCDSIYEACKIFELFDSDSQLSKKCAIISSYSPSIADIKGEESKEGQSEKLKKYNIYRKMLSEYFEEDENSAVKKIELFEKEVKEKFINAPAQMKLLIVVNKLLTGFDAPSASYLYINKSLRDHGLFQAVCRVNRLNGEDKKYGYIVDYKDLFHKLEGAIEDYTSGAFDGYEASDIVGLLSDRLTKAKEKLQEAREAIKALCEPVEEPKNMIDYSHYFCRKDELDSLKDNEPKRVKLYQKTSSLISAYANIACEMEEVGYDLKEIKTIKAEVSHFEKVASHIKLASGDYIDMKMLEPAMRKLIDMYIGASESELLTNFDEMSLIDLIVNRDINSFNESLPKSMRSDKELVNDAIENNVRKIIVDEKSTNPKYYEKMSKLLDELIIQRKNGAIDYREYLENIKELATKVKKPEESRDYPTSLNTLAKRALYDFFESDEELAIRVDTIIRHTKEDSWIGDKMKERKVANAIGRELKLNEDEIEAIMKLVKEQNEYS